MLPHTRLGARLIKKLEVYEGEIPKPKNNPAKVKHVKAEAAPAEATTEEPKA
jgi:ribosomal protein L13